MSLVQMTIAAPTTAQPKTAERRTNWVRPVIGLVLPFVALAFIRMTRLRSA